MKIGLISGVFYRVGPLSVKVTFSHKLGFVINQESCIQRAHSTRRIDESFFNKNIDGNELYKFRDRNGNNRITAFLLLSRCCVQGSNSIRLLQTQRNKHLDYCWKLQLAQLHKKDKCVPVNVQRVASFHSSKYRTGFRPESFTTRKYTSK